MDQRKYAITEINRRIAERSVEASTQLRRLGEYLAGQDSDAIQDPEFKETSQRITELRRQLPESRQQVRRILKCMEKNAELEAKLKGVASRYADLENANVTVCEEIARASYAFLREDSLGRREELEKLFAKVSRQERELQALIEGQERTRTSMRGGNLFKMIGEAGRSFFIRSALNFKRKAVARAYAEAGKQLCESQLAEQLPEGSLGRKLASYRENAKSLEKLAKEAEELRSEQSATWGELKELGAERGHQRRMREIERQIQTIESSLEESCRRLGEMFREKPVRSFTTDPEVKNRLRRASQAEKASERYRKQIRRVEAAITIDSLDAQTRGMRDKIDKLSREIKARQKEIRSLEERITAAEAERERCLKIRGSEHTLLSLDEASEEESQ